MSPRKNPAAQALSRRYWKTVSKEERSRIARARGIQRALAAGQRISEASRAFLNEYLAQTQPAA